MFTRSEKTEKILKLFREANGIVTYDRIENEIGEPIADIRQSISNARRYLERDEGVVFECIRMTGYKRLNDSEKVESSDKFTRKIRRTAGHGIRRIGTIEDYKNLSNADQLRATINKLTFETVQQETGEKTT